MSLRMKHTFEFEHDGYEVWAQVTELSGKVVNEIRKLEAEGKDENL